MNNVWPLIKYYYTWRPVLVGVAIFGILLFLLKIPALYVDAPLTFGLGITSFACMFVLPFCTGSTALRGLISNSKLAMVPGLRLQAGIALMLIALVASVFLYTSFLIFSPNPVTPFVMLRTFYCLSLFTGFMQLVLPSRHFMPIISLSPIAIVFITIQNRELTQWLFLDPVPTVILFLLTVAGWAWGLSLLKARDNFRPANCVYYDTEAWATYDGGLLSKRFIGKPETAAGTLLLGYPDGWAGIFSRVAYYYIVSPLFTTGAMFAIGIADKWDRPMMETLGGLFLAFSLISAAFCIFIYGELAARARLIWLRYGTNRLMQWRLVEKYCLRYFLAYCICGVVIVMFFRIATDFPVIYLVHYLLLVTTYCCFNLYLSLMLRTNKLSPIILVMTVAVTLLVVVIATLRAISETDTSFVLLAWTEILFLVLGIIFRQVTRKTFLGIDWKQVTVKLPGKAYTLTQD